MPFAVNRCPWLFAGLIASIVLGSSTVLALDATYARIERLAGDRQIVVDSFVPPTPYRVAVYDAQGRPISGIPLVMGPTGLDGPWRVDEFGFRGFNAGGVHFYCGFGCPPAGYTVVTGQDGVAVSRAPYFVKGPATFLYGASYTPQSTIAPQAFFTVVALSRRPVGTPKVAVEYFHPDLRRYFVTLLDGEVAALDTEKGGWMRSIGGFAAYAGRADAPPTAVPVCRFLSAIHRSHFYSAFPDECAAVAARWPDVWTFETDEAFWVLAAEGATGTCADGYQPVYRLLKPNDGVNHRYVYDRALRATMIQHGWIPEGVGPDGVAFCVPA